MQQVLEPRFSCGACGKTFKWKPEIAGKKGKCACGASIIVPMTAPQLAGAKPRVTVTTTPVVKRAVTAVATKSAGQPAARAPVVAMPVLKSPILKPAIPAPPPPVKPPPPAPPPQEAEEDQGEYDMADGMSNLDSLLPTPEAIAAAEREAPPPLPAEPVAAEPIEYQRQRKKPKKPRAEQYDPETGELSDPVRDYIVPAVLLAASLFGLGLFVTQRLGAGPLAQLAISVMFAFLLGLTLVRTLILTCIAIPLATYCDIGLGLLRSAILKIAATLLFSGVAIMLMDAALRVAGVTGRFGGGPVEWLANIFGQVVLFYLCFWYMFRLSGGGIGFAVLMSIASWITDFLLAIAFVALIFSLVVSHIPPPMASLPASQAPVFIAPGTPMTAQPGQNSATMMDAVISQQIHLNRMTEGYAWCRLGSADDADKKLISDMYNSGAVKVYVGGLATMYAQLPTDPGKRQACLDVAHAFRKKYGLPDDASVNSLNYQYIVIDLMGSHK
jgi:hypothetical protein